MTCEMDRETNLGQVKCNLCHASFTDKIDSLTEPVDIFQFSAMGGKLCVAA